MSALDLVTAFLDAWTVGDFETAGRYLADDVRFDGPITHYASAQDFLEGSRRFVAMLRPGRATVAMFSDNREARCCCTTYPSSRAVRGASPITTSSVAKRLKPRRSCGTPMAHPFRQGQAA